LLRSAISATQSMLDVGLEAPAGAAHLHHADDQTSNLTWEHSLPCSSTMIEIMFRYLASKFGCETEGITLSPVQAQRAGEISGPRGLADRCRFQVGDALDQPFSDNTFDLAWSLESGEHMPDKKCVLQLTAHNPTLSSVLWKLPLQETRPENLDSACCMPG
jgi:hypothetical protein